MVDHIPAAPGDLSYPGYSGKSSNCCSPIGPTGSTGATGGTGATGSTGPTGSGSAASALYVATQDPVAQNITSGGTVFFTNQRISLNSPVTAVTDGSIFRTISSGIFRITFNIYGTRGVGNVATISFAIYINGTIVSYTRANLAGSTEGTALFTAERSILLSLAASDIISIRRNDPTSVVTFQASNSYIAIEKVA